MEIVEQKVRRAILEELRQTISDRAAAVEAEAVRIAALTAHQEAIKAADAREKVLFEQLKEARRREAVPTAAPMAFAYKEIEARASISGEPTILPAGEYEIEAVDKSHGSWLRLMGSGLWVRADAVAVTGDLGKAHHHWQILEVI